MGYGRGGRMKIETDTAEILSGIRFQEEQRSGIHEVNFNGSQLSSGVYLYTLRAGSFVKTMKIIFIK